MKPLSFFRPFGFLPKTLNSSIPQIGKLSLSTMRQLMIFSHALARLMMRGFAWCIWMKKEREGRSGPALYKRAEISSDLPMLTSLFLRKILFRHSHAPKRTLVQLSLVPETIQKASCQVESGGGR